MRSGIALIVRRLGVTSSPWTPSPQYEMDARVKTSRSSLARVEALEDGKQLLGALDVRVRFLGSEALNRMDLSPGDGDRVHARRLRGAHVEGRVADVGRVGGTS